MSTIKGVFEDNRFIFKDNSQMTSGKFTFELKDGKLYEKSVSTSKESGKTYTLEKIYYKKP